MIFIVPSPQWTQSSPSIVSLSCLPSRLIIKMNSHPVYLNKLSKAALENSILATEFDGLTVNGKLSLPMQELLFGSSRSNIESQSPGLNLLTQPLFTTPITFSPPPSLRVGNETDTSERLRSLSETGAWYDEALFSPAITVPKANTSNVDWYGGNPGRAAVPEYCFDYYNASLPIQTSAAVSPSSHSRGIDGQIPYTAKSTDVSPTFCSGGSGRIINWNAALTPGQKAVSYPNITMDQPFELLTTLAQLNSNLGSNSINFNFNLPKLQSQSLYAQAFENPLLQPAVESTKGPDEIPEGTEAVEDSFSNLTEENIAWLQSIPKGFLEEDVHDSTIWTSNHIM